MAEQEGDFVGNMLPDELGLIHLFSNLDLDQDDEFFFEDDQRAPLVEEESTPTPKKRRTVNPYHDHLKANIRKRRKDCPKYVDVVRSFGHAFFRPDTFARKKVMAKNDEGDFEMHLKHIQNKAITEAHRSFKESKI